MQKYSHVSYTDLWDFPGSLRVISHASTAGAWLDPWLEQRGWGGKVPHARWCTALKKKMLIFFAPLSLL